MVVADAIARDRETPVLEFLFVTSLSDWEIVAGKLFSRLAYLAGALLAGLPVLALTQLFGGVDLTELALGYAGLLSCLFVVGALGDVLFDFDADGGGGHGGRLRVRDRLRLVLVLLPHRRDSDLRHALVRGPARGQHQFGARPHIVGRLRFGVAAPIAAPLHRSATSLEPRRDPRPTGVAPPRRLFPLPPIYEDYPLLWKELNQYSSAWQPGSVRNACIAALVLPIVAAMILGVTLDVFGADQAHQLAETIRAVGHAAIDRWRSASVRAHGPARLLDGRRRSSACDRERRPRARAKNARVSADTAREARWNPRGQVAGRICRLVPGADFALGRHKGFGAVTGATSPASTLILLGSIAAPLGFVASLGLWLSTASRTTLRANVTSIMCVLVMVAAPILVARRRSEPRLRGQRTAMPDWIVTAGLPPVAWVRIIVPDFPDAHGRSMTETTAILFGAAVYAIGGGLLWSAARRRLRR